MADRYDVNVVKEVPSGAKVWYKVGTAFAHKDGTGFSVELAAIPAADNGWFRFVMRPPFADNNRPLGRQERLPPMPNRPPMPIEGTTDEEEPPW